MLKKTFIILLFCISFLFQPNICKAQDNSHLKIDKNDFKSMLITCDMYGNGHPEVVDESAEYVYNTSDKNEIIYILHLLEQSIGRRTEEKNCSDVTSFNIKIECFDGTSINYMFSGRYFYDNFYNQYTIIENKYHSLKENVFALKSKKLILDKDVTLPPSAWAKSLIQESVDSELIPKWNQINYQGDIPRMEVCQLIDNLLIVKGYVNEHVDRTSLEIEKDSSFTDTADVSVNRLYDMGIVSGKAEKEFYPYDFITREELARILLNTYQYMNKDTLVVDSDMMSYKDKDRVSEWAEDGVKTMTNFGVFVGNENNEFKPQNNITKQEMVITLLKLSKIV